MAYTVLARRYRSRSFDELIGQEPVARTLRNAIASGRVAHAYLFCGSRGVGKTSAARVFAKELNGGSPDVDAAIMQGRDTDTIEIDAASNTGVDNVRDLIANAAYRPLRGKYKIYIIDEVHMLSTAAFNALLKTMEEPPEHVKFILCTTDPQKVPATIQSRCQRFDFRNIPSALVAQHLAALVKAEGLEAQPELLHMVARLGNGSMRDALTLLDRLMATGEKTLTTTLLEELLGLPDRQLVSDLIEALAKGEPKVALERADVLLSKGISHDLLIESLLLRLRDLMVLASCGPATKLVDLSDAARAEEARLAQQFDAAGLLHMIALCENVQRSARSSSTPRALLDALLVRLSLTEKLADVTSLAQQLAGMASGASRQAAPRTPELAAGAASGAPAKKW
ncbi:MAG: DNA polymerase III subunit gamma/tau [Planctomycetota bacterium]|nr:DNA polymerase III subunit gamma/tau [Planctomycetota bacterium]